MPIHLGPITRRKFLAGSAGAVATLLLPEWARSANKSPVDPNRFAILSDTHVDGKPERIVRRINMAENMRKAIADVVALEAAPAGAVFCGDLALSHGTQPAYKLFGSRLRPLSGAKIPTHLLVGNHDQRENLCAVLTARKQAEPLVEGKLISILESPRANWFLLDSLEKTKATPGLLGKKQMEWLAKALDKRKDKPAIVMAHHDVNMRPPARPGGKPRTGSGLEDAKEFLDLIGSRRQVKAYIHGHLHAWHKSTRDGLHLVGLPATAYTFSPSQPSAWVLAQLERDGISLELRCLDPKHAMNGNKFELTWRH